MATLARLRSRSMRGSPTHIPSTSSTGWSSTRTWGAASSNIQIGAATLHSRATLQAAATAGSLGVSEPAEKPVLLLSAHFPAQVPDMKGGRLLCWVNTTGDSPCNRWRSWEIVQEQCLQKDHCAMLSSFFKSWSKTIDQSSQGNPMGECSWRNQLSQNGPTWATPR